ncbi:ATP-binding cassette domain-containing protein [Wenzhouxiangella sp. XN79A]|uniref:ABC transporter ATP-binding protein n=1 Tax=Wenzhouxiangella sp. XN79A TaxID=2724193 RepID=UPI00144AA21B|nr:ATP-binding cassette domain-containing protein [Wenzhouxiangella sp. XN79A]NKI34848.1 ATP-binding cassette domain-containing protein [Wenzhouxiangella sp. XN79A]
MSDAARLPLRLFGLAAGELPPFDLEVAPGEVVAISGASGSGKSRLLRALADLDPHEGRVLLGEAAADAMPAHVWRRRVMLVPAESQWWHDAVGAHFEAEPFDDLEVLGLPRDALGWSVGRLSSGEKQRLALIRALSRDPGALLLDEPTANLDDESVERVESWLLQRIRGRGLPTLWVAHDRAQIERVADLQLRIGPGGAELVR